MSYDEGTHHMGQTIIKNVIHKLLYQKNMIVGQ